MAVPHLLTLKVIQAIKAELEALMPQALLDQAPEQSVQVTLEPPRSYFIYESAIAYRTPALFIVAERIDFRKAELAANHLNYRARVNVTAIIEDKDAERLYTKAYVYQAAMHSLLDQRELTSTPLSMKIYSVVQTAEFSPLLSQIAKDANAPGAIFRKEVSLQIDAFCFEPMQPTQ